MTETQTDTKRPVVCIHGLWLHASSREPWMALFEEHGYATLNPSWPGDSATAAESRANRGPIANRGVTEVVDRYAKVTATLDAPPIAIGHSFGRLVAQALL